MTPSTAPPLVVTISVPKDAIKIILQDHSTQDSRFPQNLVGWAGPSVALVAIYAVHRLTQSRDKEKTVFELHKSIVESVDGVRAVIITAWEDSDPSKRVAAVAQTKWRLQQIGGLVERLRKMSSRWCSSWSLPPLKKTCITITSAMGALRDNITADPFEDPMREPNLTMVAYVEQALGDFLQHLDQELLLWMD